MDSRPSETPLGKRLRHEDIDSLKSPLRDWELERGRKMQTQMQNMFQAQFQALRREFKTQMDEFLNRFSFQDMLSTSPILEQAPKLQIPTRLPSTIRPHFYTT